MSLIKLPEICILCQQSSTLPICHACLSETRMLVHTRHQIFRSIPGTSIPLYSFASYQGRVKQLVQIAKSPLLERSAILDPWLWLASKRLSEVLPRDSPLIVAPLPERRFGLDTRRRLAGDLAHLLASQLGAPCDHQLLSHESIWQRHFGKAQKERNRRERINYPPRYAVNGARRYSPTSAYRILLVDDVCTTGESLRAAIEPLRAAGFQVCAAALLADTPVGV